MEIVKQFKDLPGQESITLICVLRDEELLLPAFISHYRSLGVTHFSFIDNGSEDNSLPYLKACMDPNFQLWYTEESYAQNLYGVTWVHKVMSSYLKDRWCLVVDVDEFLLPPYSTRSLVDIRDSMRVTNANVLDTCLLEMYPDNFDKDPYTKFQKPFIHSNCFDKMSFDTIYKGGGPWGLALKGGVRSRIFKPDLPVDNKSYCLTKRSFFYYDFYDTHVLSDGMHWIFPIELLDSWSGRTVGNSKDCWDKDIWRKNEDRIRPYEQLMLLPHFKFIKPDFREFVQMRVHRNEDAYESGEYKSYLELDTFNFYDESVTEEYVGNNHLLYGHTLGQLVL